MVVTSIVHFPVAYSELHTIIVVATLSFEISSQCARLRFLVHMRLRNGAAEEKKRNSV